MKRWGERAGDMNELGAVWNGYSLAEKGKLGEAVEKVGQAVDAEYLATAQLVSSFLVYPPPDGLALTAASIMGENHDRAPAHLLPIRIAHPRSLGIPTPEARPVRTCTRGTRDAEGQARLA